MINEAVECEMVFADDVLNLGVIGITTEDMREYLQFCADQRLAALKLQPIYHSKIHLILWNYKIFELTNFFERRVAAYQMGVTGEVNFNEDFSI